MKTTFQISIPSPCKENWSEMAKVDQGRFCQSCQKKVFDFTQSSDRAIAKVLQSNSSLCGRFAISQLNRELIVPKEKSSIWLTSVSSIISFLGIGTENYFAQEKPLIVQQTASKDNSKSNELIQIEGEIFGDEMEKLSNVLITVKNKANILYSDEEGKFSVTINAGDTLLFYKKDYLSDEITFNAEKGHYRVFLEKDNLHQLTSTTVGGIQTIKKRRTLFGRIFHSIGKIFR